MIHAIPTYKSEPDYRVWSSLDTAALIPAFFLTRSLFRPPASVRVVIIRRRDSAALFARPTGRKEEKKEKEEEGKT